MVERERKPLWNDLAEEEIHVGNRQRPPSAVACGTGVGAGTLGADEQFHAIKTADAASSCGHGLNRQHRSDNAYARLDRFKLSLKSSIETRDISARPTHVKADRFCETCPLSDA